MNTIISTAGVELFEPSHTNSYDNLNTHNMSMQSPPSSPVRTSENNNSHLFDSPSKAVNIFGLSPLSSRLPKDASVNASSCVGEWFNQHRNFASPLPQMSSNFSLHNQMIPAQQTSSIHFPAGLTSVHLPARMSAIPRFHGNGQQASPLQASPFSQSFQSPIPQNYYTRSRIPKNYQLSALPRDYYSLSASPQDNVSQSTVCNLLSKFNSTPSPNSNNNQILDTVQNIPSLDTVQDNNQIHHWGNIPRHDPLTNYLLNYSTENNNNLYQNGLLPQRASDNNLVHPSDIDNSNNNNNTKLLHKKRKPTEKANSISNAPKRKKKENTNTNRVNNKALGKNSVKPSQSRNQIENCLNNNSNTSSNWIEIFNSITPAIRPTQQEFMNAVDNNDYFYLSSLGIHLINYKMNMLPIKPKFPIFHSKRVSSTYGEFTCMLVPAGFSMTKRGFKTNEPTYFLAELPCSFWQDSRLTLDQKIDCTEWFILVNRNYMIDTTLNENKPNDDDYIPQPLTHEVAFNLPDCIVKEQFAIGGGHLLFFKSMSAAIEWHFGFSRNPDGNNINAQSKRKPSQHQKCGVFKCKGGVGVPDICEFLGYKFRHLEALYQRQTGKSYTENCLNQCKEEYFNFSELCCMNNAEFLSADKTKRELRDLQVKLLYDRICAIREQFKNDFNPPAILPIQRYPPFTRQDVLNRYNSYKNTKRSNSIEESIDPLQPTAIVASQVNSQGSKKLNRKVKTKSVNNVEL